ncbi:MAG: DUF2264 domain-containing protein [Chitinophagaceae bacterium]
MKERRSFLKNISLAGIVSAFGGKLFASENAEGFTDTQLYDGADDRAYWSELLYKMSAPVVMNLANGTLKKNMPVEKAPGFALNPAVTYLEAVGRTVAGIAPWLALPDDDTAEGKKRKTLRTALLKGLSNAVNPASPDYLHFRKDAQPIVDAAYMAHAFLRAPAALWEPLDETTKQRWITEFKSLRDRKGAYNNWLLFAGITEGFLLKIGAGHDPFRIDLAIRKMDEWYTGDSWYKDGDKFSMDYYNSYVIHPMLVDLLAVTTEKKMTTAAQYEQALKRMVRHAEFLERMITPEGYYPAFGRSITYRTGAFQALAQVALMEKLPQHISPAQVRSGLSAVMRNMYKNGNNFNKEGWLVLGFCGSQPMIADYYTSTGSLYMATLGFLPLGLPPEHAFWTDAPEEWTAQKAWSGKPFKKDYKVEY